ncbi:MAG: hypothetical protein WBE83_06890 [Candidatus Cybelea sp.]|jgi:hypothetical protein
MRLRTDLLADFPEWFTLRGHAGVFRIDRLRSACEGIVVLADIGGREVGRCSVDELRESLYEAA